MRRGEPPPKLRVSEGQVEGGPGAFPVFDLEFPVDGGHSFFHIIQSIPEFSQFGHIDAYAIVLYLDHEPVIYDDIDPDDGTLGVFQYIIKGFFDGEKDIPPPFPTDLPGGQ